MVNHFCAPPLFVVAPPNGGAQLKSGREPKKNWETFSIKQLVPPPPGTFQSRHWGVDDIFHVDQNSRPGGQFSLSETGTTLTTVGKFPPPAKTHNQRGVNFPSRANLAISHLAQGVSCSSNPQLPHSSENVRGGGGKPDRPGGQLL